MGFTISIAGLALAGVIAVYSSAWAAGLIGTAALVSLVKLFLVDPLSKKEKSNKVKITYIPSTRITSLNHVVSS